MHCCRRPRRPWMLWEEDRALSPFEEPSRGVSELTHWCQESMGFHRSRLMGKWE